MEEIAILDFENPLSNATMTNQLIIAQKEIESLIYTIRGKQVMLDSDLAGIYQVETKIFNMRLSKWRFSLMPTTDF